MPRASTSHRAFTSPHLLCSGTSGIDPATVDPTADFLADPTVPTEELVILRFRDRKERAVTNVQRIDSREVLGAGDGSSDLPSSFVTLAGLRRHGWQQVASGWLVESSRPLTSEQIAAARELAAERRPHDRSPAREHLPRDAHRDRNRSRRAPGARDPRHDRRADPQRERRRPPHPDRHRSHEPDTAHTDGAPPQARSPSSARSSESPAPTSHSQRHTSTTSAISVGSRCCPSSSLSSASR